MGEATACLKDDDVSDSLGVGFVGLNEATPAEKTSSTPTSGMDRRSGAKGLQGAADVLEQQHQMKGIRG
ncbi:MAG: hypothetical protein RLZZ216_884 [Cyanobacteriota bacterium]|jgi:hypothetical protein